MKLLTDDVAVTFQARALRATQSTLKERLRVSARRVLAATEHTRQWLSWGKSSFRTLSVGPDQNQPSSSRSTYAREPVRRDPGGEHIYPWALEPEHDDPETVIRRGRAPLFALDVPRPSDVWVYRIEFPYAQLSGWCVSTGDAEPFFRTLERVDALQRGREAAAQRRVRCFIETTDAYKWVTSTG